ncbi:hydratase [Candidatus Bathyarchaeota archaeon]|nr:MAG: hydratase [Candidatus Bathyarchaeota archaeon]RLI31617.1 MAG: hydratase [Candidatus Bathyarchaeota archaeon]
MEERVRESLVRVACCQLEPRVGCKEENVEKTLRFVEEAVKEGAEVVVLPELANTGYVFETRREAFGLSEPVPEGPTTEAWEETAKEHGIYIAAGIAEREGHSLYNTGVLLGPEGYLGKYRKLHLWYREKLFFEPGDLGLPVFNTEIGRLAMMICYDMWFPEVARIYAVQGVDLLLNITNWVAAREPRGEERVTMAICMGQSHVNSVFMAAADRVGVERGQAFLGHSLITAPTGLPIAGPASRDREEIIIAECNLSEARKAKRKTRLNFTMLDRRIDIYDVLLGYEALPFPW